MNKCHRHSEQVPHSQETSSQNPQVNKTVMYRLQVSKMDSTEQSKKKVTFCEITYLYYEPTHLSKDLNEARKNDYRFRQALKSRYEKLLYPILDENHRLIVKFRQLNLNS